ncbi:carbon-monoxide dehydrogenase medium subunit/xanthine dehydrogenase small subunit [Actinacidiphila yanglinensis]|uniref:Carbon-monoxide dehydrogenase medium subunit/xanthine dehydrogenase small subunit n=1 Tax=Actinacidiphila yanglinensis TaxID=310779 RepID=A0A1H6EFR6_9ACTN|nr:FAD binding domain-containing protein [Actinacidiphila yanglinensis]SEG96131.1 carbon-monoxide dehydrogenase medium subunit/xanthine dehydrogenase small subunit [Actinacidiphila yanglinensis]
MTTLDHGPAPTDAAREPVHLLRAGSLTDALAQLATEGAVPLGGGVGHALARQARRPVTARTLVAVADIPELAGIAWTDDRIVIGAGVRLDAIASDTRLREEWPVVAEAAGSVATARIRRMVTLGGNIAARDDSHDPPVALAAAGAVLTVRGAGHRRTLPVTEVGSLSAGELVQDVRLPRSTPGARIGSAYEKFLVRGVWEYACVNVGAVVALDESGTVERLSVAVGSVTGGPVVVDLGALPGRVPDADLVAEAARLAAAATRPYSDVRGSAAYKSLMIAEFTRRAVSKAALRAAGGADR